MKRIVIAVLAAVLAALAVGCASTPSPTAVTKQALDAFKAQDFATMQKYYAGNAESMDVADLAGGASGIDLSAYTDDQKAMVEQVVNAMTAFDYELGTETVDGEKATVAAKITTYDLGTVFSETMGDYFKQALASAFSGSAPGEEEMTTLFVEIFSEKLASHNEKTHVADVTFNLVRQDGEWKLENFDDATVDAIMGGMISGIKDFADNLGSIANPAA